MSVCIIDTTVFCNILEVPNRCQDRDEVLQELEERVENEDTLLLPLATIYETGNHIAHTGDGRQRRAAAERFATQVDLALQGENPFTPTDINDEDEIRLWLEQFPDYAQQEIGFGDMSIIETFHKHEHLHPSRRVYIWALDEDLSGYDRPPKI
jgi:hypothetical protein